MPFRPTLARIHELQIQASAQDAFIAKLKLASGIERERLLSSTSIIEGRVKLPEPSPSQSGEPLQLSSSLESNPPRTTLSGADSGANETTERTHDLEGLDDSSGDDLDIGPFLSMDEAGKPSSFGPSSALHYYPANGSSSSHSTRSLARDHIRNALIAEAALQRQNERQLALCPNIHGVPTELALHLLELHWSRQHHTLLLTYRPAITRDLLQGGPNCSRFLLYALCACASKFSSRIEIRDDPGDVSTAGRAFFRRCDELLAEDTLLIHPTVPTVIGLLLLGSSYNAKGETSKGWLYTGYALRMIYDLGLHLDPKETVDSPEQVEIRRRVFWGAFVSDKLQSLYLGRPAAINLRDSHVSRDFLDTLEEQELHVPYIDPKYPNPPNPQFATPTPAYSVSTFQQLCLLSRIMAKIINTFYVVGASPRNGQARLQIVDKALQAWRTQLPPKLEFESQQIGSTLASYPPPNLMNVHALYHSLVVLLHRPFVSDGHLRSTATPALSWGRCTCAARSITNIAMAWKDAYSLRGAPYLLSYAIYVACTIHVRNSAAEATGSQSKEHTGLLAASLTCLEQLCLANPGVSKPMNIIRRLMEASKVQLETDTTLFPNYSPASFDFDTIYSMFPDRSATNWNPNNRDVAFDSSMPHDPLFGLMDESLLSFPEVSETIFHDSAGF
ncbi:fungal-specific transcription factor domain-containing protein [Exophiala viscosa]|uniref:Fungal-specific transcription factor domain-containing protein n=1 Tax=Exophiala viscosa TaxID=2486360 RepID=A0AAN6ICI0_9EURO|nr:fungal-specific transcription factor domain-containing protein [Exophiala viscosa]KAI1619927.1 fungal-specific transcription factor domain-containing protein [Exophiala viscosa]